MFYVDEGAKTVSAHRYSYSLVHGDPGELQVLHKCDNPKCVRPEHLFLGTRTDNMVDATSKGRLTRKLNEQSVATIRARFANGGVTQKALAEEYGVSPVAIRFVLNRRNWKHVP